MVTADELAPLCHAPDVWLQPLNDAMEEFRIEESRTEVVQFLATCAYESAAFQRTEEGLNYSAGGLLRMWPSRFSTDEARRYEYNPRAIANRVYANRNGNGNEASGDGWRFRGSGPMQLTFRGNFEACGDALGLALVDDPDLVRVDPVIGARAAAWFWYSSGCGPVAREGDFPGVQGIVNRGSRHRMADNMPKRSQWLAVASRALPV